MTELEDELRERIVAYLRDRVDFEMGSYRRFEAAGAPDEAFVEQEMQRFAAYRARHLGAEAEPVMTFAPHGTVDADSVR